MLMLVLIGGTSYDSKVRRKIVDMNSKEEKGDERLLFSKAEERENQFWRYVKMTFKPFCGSSIKSKLFLKR